MRPHLQLVTLIFVLFAFKPVIFAQKEWSKAELEKANTAKNITYLTEEEKQIIFYSNLVRLNPQLFRDTFLKHYIDSAKSNNSRYVKSLLKTLETTSTMQLLYPSESLYKIAKEHAIEFGKQGKTGHGNFKKRFQNYFNKCECTVAENCYYGDTLPLNVVIELLIDENISDLSHRKNLLNPALKKTGVFISSHKTYKKSSVMDFSSSSATD